MILCGGAGTRLWPVSRQDYPKQYLALTGDQSLLQQTLARLSGGPFSPTILVSGEDQRTILEQQLEQAASPVEAIILEPAARNTSAAAALAAVWVQAGGADELLLLMPSDHVIGDRDAFLKAVETGLPHAENGAIVTFGARPTAANSQYGYIEAADGTGFGDGAFRIARFHEKPDADKAAEYLRSGRFHWNAGIFLAKASTFVEEMRLHLPASLDAIARSIADATCDALFVRPDIETFSRAENISIDHAIMEKTARGIVIPVQMGWSDVGSWDAVWKLGSKDAAGNVIHGDVIALDTSQSLIRSEDGPLVAAIGLGDMAVIASGDAVLVAPLDRMSELKQLVEEIKRRKNDAA